MLMPPRKCELRAPRAKLSWLARMKSSAPPWNQVAIMTPSWCQTERNSFQRPVSRHVAQFSISSRMARRSARSVLVAMHSDAFSSVMPALVAGIHVLWHKP